VNQTLSLTIEQRLRGQAVKLRTKPVPLLSLIPLINDAADEIEMLRRDNAKMKKHLDEIYTEWPGGLDEIDSAWRNWRERAIAHGWKKDDE
jgi:hypothetical protein